MSISAHDSVLSRPRRRVVLLLITLTVFFGELSYSVVVPILPSQAEKFGWSEIEIGLLLGCFGLSGLATAPFVCRISNKFGPRRLFFMGLSASGDGHGAVCSRHGLRLDTNGPLTARHFGCGYFSCRNGVYRSHLINRNEG